MFVKALPITIPEIAEKMNTFATFHVNLPKKGASTLKITGFSFYQIFINEKFVAFGPARTAKGYARVDEIPLDLSCDNNELVISLAGYYCKGLSTVLQPMFLQAEVECEGEILAYTGKDFSAFTPLCKRQKTQRYSFQYS